MFLKVPDKAKEALHSLIATVHSYVQAEVKAGRYQLTLPKVGEPIQLVQTLSSDKSKTPKEKVIYEDSPEIPFLAQYYNLLCTTSEKLWDKIDGEFAVLLAVKGLLPDLGTVIDGLNLAKKYGLFKPNKFVDLLLKNYETDADFAELKELFKSLDRKRPFESENFPKVLEKIKYVYFHKIKPDLLRLIADKKSGHFAWELYEQLFPMAEFFLNNFEKIFFQNEKLLIVRPEYYTVLRETIRTLKTILQVIGKADLGKYTRGNIDYIIDWALWFGEMFGETPPEVKTYNTMLSIEAPDKTRLDQGFLHRGTGNELMDFVVDVSPLEKPYVIKFRKPKILETYQLLIHLSEQEVTWKGIPKDLFLYMNAFLIGLIVKECPLYLQLDSFEYFYSYYVNQEGKTQLEPVPPAIEFKEEFTQEISKGKLKEPHIFVEAAIEKINELAAHSSYWIELAKKAPDKKVLDGELTKSGIDKSQFHRCSYTLKLPRLIKCKDSLWIYNVNVEGETSFVELKKPAVYIKFPTTPIQQKIRFTNDKAVYEKQCAEFNFINQHKPAALSKLWCAHNDVFEVVDAAIAFPLDLMANDGYRLGLKDNEDPELLEFLIAQGDQSAGIEGVVYALRTAHKEVKEGLISHEQLQAALGDRYKTFVVALEKKDLPTLQTFLRDLLNIVGQDVAPTVFKPFVVNSLVTAPAPVNQHLKFWQDLDDSILKVSAENQKFAQYLDSIAITMMSGFLITEKTDNVILANLKNSYEREIKIRAEINKRAVELDGVRKEMALEKNLGKAPKISFFDPLVAFKSLALVEESKPRNHVTKETFEPVLEKIQTQNSQVAEKMALKIKAFDELTDFLKLSITMEEAYLAVLEKQQSVAEKMVVGDIGFDRNARLNFATQLSQMMTQGFDWSEIERENSQFKQFFPQLKAWYAIRWQNDLKPLHDRLIQQILQHDVKTATDNLTIDREKSLKEFVEELTKLTAAINEANEEELSQLEITFAKIFAQKNVFDRKLCLQILDRNISTLVNDPYYQELSKAYFASLSALSDLASIQVLAESFSAQIKSVEAVLKNRREAFLLESGNAVQKLEMEIEAHKQQVEKDKVVLQEISELDSSYQAVYQKRINELEENKREIVSVSAKKSTAIQPDKKAYAVDLAGISKEITPATDPGYLQIQEELKALNEVIPFFESQSVKLRSEKNIIQSILLKKELNEKIADEDKQLNAIGVYEKALNAIISFPRNEQKIKEALAEIEKNQITINESLKYKDSYSRISGFVERFKTETWYWESNFKSDLEESLKYAGSRKTSVLSLKVANQKQQRQVVSDLGALKQQLHTASPDAQEFSADTEVLKNQLEVVEKSIPLVEQQRENSIKRRMELQSTHKKLTAHNQQLQKLFDVREKSEESLANFSSDHKNQLQKKYNGLSSSVTLAGDRVEVSVQNIAYLIEKNKQIAQLEYRLVLCQMKQNLIAKEEALRALEKLIDAFEIPDLIYHKIANREDSSLASRWDLHEKKCKGELQAAEGLLTNYHASLSILDNDLNVWQRAQEKLEADERRPPEDKNSLLLLKKNAEMLQRLFELKKSVIAKHLARKSSLETEKERFIAEDGNWRIYEQHLSYAEELLEKVNRKIEFLEKRPTNMVQQVVNATCAENAILLEDEHFASSADAIQLYRVREKEIQQLIVFKSELSDLEIEFNEALNQLLSTIREQLAKLDTQYAAKKAAWDQLFNANRVMLNSRELLASNDHNNRDYSYYDLRGIRLSDRDFSTARMRNAKFNRAKLTNCKFASRLDNVDFTNADISTCTFDDNASFQNVIINDGTNIGIYGPKILRDNFVYPDYHNTSEYYATLLQCITPTGDDILNILKGIGTARICPNKSSEQQLIARKARAVMVVELMLPKLQSIEEVIKLKALIDTKHQEANNPFAYIRQEQDWLKNIFGFKYGNTGTWQKISEMIKNHLFTLSQQRDTNSLSLQNYQNAEKIMKTHTRHDYGFGFFYTPKEASQWKEEKSRLVTNKIR